MINTSIGFFSDMFIVCLVICINEWIEHNVYGYFKYVFSNSKTVDDLHI